MVSDVDTPTVDIGLATTIFVEELRSENIQIRVNAIRRLQSIAKSLGPEKAISELFPIINDVLEDEDEVLLALAEELGNLIEVIGGPNYARFLLHPLELAAGVEETMVRTKAVESLVKVALQMPKEEFEQFLMPCIRRLSTGDWFSPRSSACSLFHVVYPNVPSEFKEELRILYAKLSLDNTPMVRRAAASNLKYFIKVVDKVHIKTDLMNSFKAQAKDEQDSVRLLTVENCIAMAQLVDKDEQLEYILPVVESCARDKSWRVRYMVANQFVALCHSMAREFVKNEFVDYFVGVLNDTEAEVRIEAASKITGFASLIDLNVVIKSILPCIHALANDSNQQVRASLASDVMGLTTIFSESTTEHLLDILVQLLQDDFPEVKLNILSKINNSIKLCQTEVLSSRLMVAILQLAQDKRWRVRLTIIEYIPLLACELGSDFFFERVGKLYMVWLGDPVYSVREAATISLKQVTEIFGVEWTQEQIIPRVLVLRSSPNYLHRMIFLLAISSLSSVLTPILLNNTILGHVLEMASDSVPNIRFNVAKTLEKLIPLLDVDMVNTKVRQVLDTLVQDPDTDVQYYSCQTLKLIT